MARKRPRSGGRETVFVKHNPIRTTLFSWRCASCRPSFFRQDGHDPFNTFCDYLTKMLFLNNAWMTAEEPNFATQIKKMHSVSALQNWSQKPLFERNFVQHTACEVNDVFKSFAEH
jgi:hypothetical protein